MPKKAAKRLGRGDYDYGADSKYKPKGPWTREFRDHPSGKDARNFDKNYWTESGGKILTPSFEHAIDAYPKEKTKFYKNEGSDDEKKDKKKKKGKKKGGNASFADKAANLGAYVV